MPLATGQDGPGALMFLAAVVDLALPFADAASAAVVLLVSGGIRAGGANEGDREEPKDHRVWMTRDARPRPRAIGSRTTAARSDHLFSLRGLRSRAGWRFRRTRPFPQYS